MGGRIFRAIGLMSGTSMDGIDVAAIETDGERVTWTAAATTVPYPPSLRVRLAEAIRHPDGDYVELERELTDAHVDAVRAYLETLPEGHRHIDLIGFHGHTLVHRPERHFTRQLGDGERLAQALGIDTVFDFRSNDVAAGGEGAPFAPVYHRALARGTSQPAVFVNIGGVSNITYVDGDFMLAFDTGPGNALVDDWMLAHTGRPYDANGATAARGKVDAAVLARLLDNPYFARRPPKSLDRLDFSAEPARDLSLEDGAATLTAFTARAIARAVEHLPKAPAQWLITGGGRLNGTLMRMLAEALPTKVAPIEAIGADGDGLEAQAFAFMAVRSLLGLPISFPETTGVPEPMRGGRLVKAAA
ncbi:MAG: anhydro-N-acetylmuramic acid kinase [Devosia sp.]|nr:anhydro-N-acetylmuramic acid kinase [Devosia sp.]